jgi:hypothetical protein
MEMFAKLFGSLLVFVYHCFDRIVINGYLSGVSRAEQVVYFFREVVGKPRIDKEVLSERTTVYRQWVKGYAANRDLEIVWAERKARKEEIVLPALRAMERRDEFGVYFIFCSLEQGPSFRCSKPKYPTKDPNYVILAPQRSRYTHYYFYIRDEVLGPISLRVGSFFPFQTTYWLNGHSVMERELIRRGVGFRKDDNAFRAVDDPKLLQQIADRLDAKTIAERLDYWSFHLGPKFSQYERKWMNLRRVYAIAQIEYCRNFIFKRHFPIHKIFERSCELGLWKMTANKISEVFGLRLTKKLKGKLYTTLEQLDRGRHTFRAYCKNSFIKQYEKYSTFLRNEVCSNNLKDFGLRKGLQHLDCVREKFQAITERFAGFQATILNVHGDFPLLQRLALPVTQGTVRYPGIKIHDTRLIRLMEVLLHANTTLMGQRVDEIHTALLTQFHIKEKNYAKNQLRYDLRKLKGHGLIERDGNRYAYRLTDKGTKVAVLMVLFHQRVCGPLANSLLHHRPDPAHQPQSKIEKALHKADDSINNVIELLKAA